jgi:glycosyltransferase involved in cell wall biosynthesis
MCLLGAGTPVSLRGNVVRPTAGVVPVTATATDPGPGAMKLLHSQVMAGVAGSENVLLRLLPALRARGHEVHFLCVHAGDGDEVAKGFCDRLTREGVTTELLRHRGLLDFRLLAALDRIVVGGKFDLVHTHLLKTDGIFAAARLRYNRRHRQVSTKHGYRESVMERFGLDPARVPRDQYWLAARLAESQITASSAVSAGVAGLFCGLGITAESRMHVTHLGFDYPTEHDTFPDLRFGEPQMCQVGRLVECKGQEVAISATGLLRHEFPGISLVLVGGGPRESELRKFAEELGVGGHVHFVGHQTAPIGFMRASDVVLVPSKAEGFGLVILEAMAAGRAVVAFDVPAPNEVLRHGVTGLLVPPYSVTAYAEAIAQLLRRPSERAQLADRASIDLTSRFSTAAMVDGFERFYARALVTEPPGSYLPMSARVSKGAVDQP